MWYSEPNGDKAGSQVFFYSNAHGTNFYIVKKLAKEALSEKELEDFKAEVEILMHLRPHANVIGFDFC